MRKFQAFALLFTFLFLFAGVAAAAEPAAPPAAPPKPLAQGDKLAKLSLTDLDGKVADVAVDKGLVAITFFNTSCSACKAEMALLDAFAKQNKALKVIAVSVDAQGAKTTKPFVDSNKLKFDFFVDPEFKSPERFGFSFSPALVIIQDGEIALKHAGFMNKDEEMLSKILLK